MIYFSKNIANITKRHIFWGSKLPITILDSGLFPLMQFRFWTSVKVHLLSNAYCSSSLMWNLYKAVTICVRNKFLKKIRFIESFNMSKLTHSSSMLLFIYKPTTMTNITYKTDLQEIIHLITLTDFNRMEEIVK